MSANCVCRELPSLVVARRECGEKLPAAADRLARVGGDAEHHFRRCPGCGALFSFHAVAPGTGRRRREELARFSLEEERHLASTLLAQWGTICCLRRR